MTEFRSEDIEKQPNIWSEQLHPDNHNRVIASLEARRKSGRSSIEYRWQCADGSYKHFLDQGVLLRDGDGRPVEFAGTLTDISEQRSLESQLIQAQKMDAIGKLTGGIAHDFNNLLAAVIGGLGLLEKRASLDPEQGKILAMTKRAAENREVEADNWAGIPAGDYVLLSVADTGTGIAPKDLEKVMDPFFTTKDVGKGSGLGLSMVYGFAKQSNGAFRLDSELGHGTI